MPFARFAKLAPEKREQLLDVAAREFARHGYADSSINRILEAASMSKGAAYYYFEDKADLFCTVVRYAIDYVQVPSGFADLGALTAANFWPAFSEAHRAPLLRCFERPWIFAVIRVAAQVAPALRERESLVALAEEIHTLVLRLLARGQELGVIRTDLATELLFAWLAALDRASDGWLLDHWADLDRAALARISDETVAAMRAALAPAPAG